MSNHPAIPLLVALHAELGGKRLACRKEAERLADGMKHIEAVIKLCDPDYSVHRIAVRRRNRTNPWFKRGHMFRAVLDALKAATEPLTTWDIAKRMLTTRGVKEPASDDIRRLETSVRETFRGGLAKHVIADGSTRRGGG